MVVDVPAAVVYSVFACVVCVVSRQGWYSCMHWAPWKIRVCVRGVIFSLDETNLQTGRRARGTGLEGGGGLGGEVRPANSLLKTSVAPMETGCKKVDLLLCVN